MNSPLSNHLPRVANRAIATLSAIAVCCCVSGVSAQVTQVYSFEPGLEGFAPNGGGIMVAQDTIGATDGTSSMKVSIVSGASFVGALTGNLAPAIGDPPGVDFVRFDLTILEQFPTEPGDFIDTSIMLFGSSQPDYPGGQLEGLQLQFFVDQVPLGDLDVGTHEVQIDLTTSTHPLTFEDGSFNDIIGTEGSGEFDIIPTGFQIYFSKSSTAPWTGYIDNVRVGLVVEGLAGDYNGNDEIDAADYTVWRDAMTAGATDLLNDSTPGTVDESDFVYWRDNFGDMLGSGAGSGTAVIPEPGSGLLLLVGGLLLSVERRGRTNC